VPQETVNLSLAEKLNKKGLQWKPKIGDYTYHLRYTYRYVSHIKQHTSLIPCYVKSKIISLEDEKCLYIESLGAKNIIPIPSSHCIWAPTVTDLIEILIDWNIPFEIHYYWGWEVIIREKNQRYSGVTLVEALGEAVLGILKNKNNSSIANIKLNPKALSDEEIVKKYY
jgi:hypothetical protein